MRWEREWMRLRVQQLWLSKRRMVRGMASEGVGCASVGGGGGSSGCGSVWDRDVGSGGEGTHGCGYGRVWID